MTQNLCNEFFEAVRDGDAATVEKVLAAHPEAVNWIGGNWSRLPEEWHRPLHVAVANGQLEVAKLLLGPSGGTEAADSYHGHTPLIEAARADRPEVGEKMTRYLLEQGADPNAAAPSGTTPLMCAALNFRNTQIIQLLKAGADIQARSPEGTSLHLAANHAGPPDHTGLYYKDRETVRLLLENGAGTPQERQALAAASSPAAAGAVLDAVVTKYRNQHFRRFLRADRLKDARQKRDQFVLENGTHRRMRVKKPVKLIPQS